MASRTWSVRSGVHDVTATLDATGDGDDAPLLVLAHGAGGNMTDRGMRAVAAELVARGMRVVRFNFPYAEHGGRRPDPMPLLQDCIAAVVARVRADVAAQRVVIGGRSMGGRAASMLAADGYACDGLLLLAYPLHPAGQPEKLRDAHLRRITTPVLCLNGTRDALCRRDLMDTVVGRLAPNWRMHWLDGADHSFRVLKASGRSDADVLEEIGAATAAWTEQLRSATAGARHSPR
jgi:predicted alpha/beta-hydrolase family hydrolase